MTARHLLRTLLSMGLLGCLVGDLTGFLVGAARAEVSSSERDADSLALPREWTPLGATGAGVKVMQPEPTQAALVANRAAVVTGVFESDSLGQQWSRWIMSRPGGCEAFRGGGYLIGMMDYWAYRCWSAFEGGHLSSYSYLLGSDEEPTVEGLIWTIGPASGLDSSALEGLWRRLAEKLSSRFGKANRPPPDSIEGAGAAEWRDVTDFATPSGTLRLYRVPSTESSGLDSLVAEHSSSRLLAEATQDLPTGEFGEPEVDSIPRARAHQEVSRALATRWPALAGALRPSGSRREDLPTVREALVLAQGQRVAQSSRDLLQYGVHLWLKACSSLPGWAEGDSATVRPILASLRGFGVQIVRSYDGNWCYDGALADSLALRAGESHWADLAFVELLDRGWESPCGLCGWDKPFGPDQFKPVIEYGEKYLAAHPHSAIASVVALRVAEAHETAWSLSKASPEDDIDWRQYVLAAPQHRVRAMALYEGILEGRPGLSDPALRKRLRRMRLDIDTYFYKYWCFWD